MATKIMADDTYRRIKEEQIRDLWAQNKIDSEKAVDLIKKLNKVIDSARDAEVTQDLFERDLMHAEEGDDDEFI